MTAMITPLYTFPLSCARCLVARSGEGLAGLMTRSGTLDARPRQDMLPLAKRRDYTTGIPVGMLYLPETHRVWKNMKPVIKQLLLIFVLNLAFSFLIQGTADYLEIRNNRTALDHAVWIFTDQIGDDSWRPMRLALDYWTESRGQGLIYSDLLIQRNVKFQYPPTALLISKFIETNHIGSVEFSTVTTFIFMFLMLAGVVGITLYSYQEYDAPELSPVEKISVGILLALLLFTFYPAVKAGTLGQIQVWLNALFTLAILCYITGYQTLAGILLGITASIKPQYALFAVWGLIREDKRLVIAMLVTGGIGLAAGIREYGLATFVDYLRGLSFLSRHGESFYSNQSFNGMAGRFFSVRYPDVFNNLRWRGYYFPPYNFWIFSFTQITSIAILAMALIKGKIHSKESQVADFCLMGLALTMASPIAWEHHYGILFPIFVCLGLVLWFGNSTLRSKWAKIAFVAMYLTAANFIPVASLLAPTYFNVIQSYLFFAACGVFILLWIEKNKIGGQGAGGILREKKRSFRLSKGFSIKK